MSAIPTKSESPDWSKASREDLLCRVVQLEGALRVAGRLLGNRENHNDLSVQLLEQWGDILRQGPRPSVLGKTPEAAREALQEAR